MCFLCSHALAMPWWVLRLWIHLHIAGAAQKKGLTAPSPSLHLTPFLFHSQSCSFSFYKMTHPSTSVTLNVSGSNSTAKKGKVSKYPATLCRWCKKINKCPVYLNIINQACCSASHFTLNLSWSLHHHAR